MDAQMNTGHLRGNQQTLCGGRAQVYAQANALTEPLVAEATAVVAPTADFGGEEDEEAANATPAAVAVAVAVS